MSMLNRRALLISKTRILKISTAQPTRVAAVRTIHSESQWEDVRQRKEIKPIEFYEKHALEKQYFYHVNLFGHLFIEDVLPKNITSCLKSDKFLDFFFSQLKLNNTGQHSDYPFVSPCGKEMNFIKSADPYGAIVLREFDSEKQQFQFGGNKFQPLNPSSFVISSEGRLYHELTQHRYANELGNLALIRSQVALSLCENNVEFGEEEEEEEEEETTLDDDEPSKEQSSLSNTFFLWEGKKYPIKSFEQHIKSSKAESKS